MGMGQTGCQSVTSEIDQRAPETEQTEKKGTHTWYLELSEKQDSPLSVEKMGIVHARNLMKRECPEQPPDSVCVCLAAIGPG